MFDCLGLWESGRYNGGISGVHGVLEAFAVLGISGGFAVSQAMELKSAFGGV